MPRGAFLLTALAPLVVLNAVFTVLLLGGILPAFSYLALLINTLGSIGDLWIVIKLAPHARSIFVKDTMTGIEVWTPKTGD